jgi:dTDP-4-amino-4,6-dideoxygalactose transaminase
MTPEMDVAFLDLGAATAELRTELDEALRAVVDGGRYVLGPEVAAFEAAFAAEVGAAHAVGVGNGYDALVLGLRALGVGPGDDVLVAANTYVATWLAVSAVGARPVGVEADAVTGNIDPGALEQACTDRTTAVLPVHLYGHPAPMEPIVAWARRHGVAVLADAAHAHGATLGGRPVGSFGDAAAWSFYPSKNLGALGDGGAVTTDDPAVAERVRRLRHYGAARRDVYDGIGVNSRLDELQAAVLRVKLRHLKEWNRRRAVAAGRYQTGLAGLALALPAVDEGVGHAWHLFVVRTPARDQLRARLAARGAQTLVHYPTPPFAQRAYAHLGVEPGAFPLTTRWAEEVLSLPFGPHLSRVQQDVVIAALLEAADLLDAAPADQERARRRAGAINPPSSASALTIHPCRQRRL